MELDGYKIDLISDTHTQHRKIDMPGGDMVICAGDISYQGAETEIIEFFNWFMALPYTHKIMIAGNHDWGFEKAPKFYEEEARTRGIILLNDSGCVVDGIKVWGSPVQPWFCDWAFNVNRGAEIKKHWDLIPEDTEILVTHGPPISILDEVPRGDRHGYQKTDKFGPKHAGCEDLYNKIWKTQVKLHVFGHIHEGRGCKYELDKMFVNASSLDGRYRMVTGKPIRVVKGIDDIYLLDSKQ